MSYFAGSCIAEEVSSRASAANDEAAESDEDNQDPPIALFAPEAEPRVQDQVRRVYFYSLCKDCDDHCVS